MVSFRLILMPMTMILTNRLRCSGCLGSYPLVNGNRRRAGSSAGSRHDMFTTLQLDPGSSLLLDIELEGTRGFLGLRSGAVSHSTPPSVPGWSRGPARCRWDSFSHRLSVRQTAASRKSAWHLAKRNKTDRLTPCPSSGFAPETIHPESARNGRRPACFGRRSRGVYVVYR